MLASRTLVSILIFSRCLDACGQWRSSRTVHQHPRTALTLPSDVQGQGSLTQIQSPPEREIRRVVLKPISMLPDIYRGVFNKFGSFNAVQSACFDHLVKTDQNLVVSAPTGSGKTVLFELAIIRLHTLNKSVSNPTKCVYVAPTKALCTEKFNEWTTKFEPIGLKCCELTGDTAGFGQDIWGQAKSASIMYGEKWDSLTRNWWFILMNIGSVRSDHERILSLVHLFLVDEVHVLGETRGSTLEVVVSRMKMRGSGTRFVLVSATVPNIDDIACWIGNSQNSGPAITLKFGEEYRPCKLTRHVVGFGRRREQNTFQFVKILDAKLFGVIQKYSAGKPILVFVATRKGVFATAEQLMKEYKECENKRLPVPWTHPSRIDVAFYDKKLSEFGSYGIGVHHAGLTMEDRRSTEQLYIQKQIRILVATSTLAVGVNLPAHLVIVKGVQTFQNGAEVEYSDLDITQMLGRAGRPQFDTEGTAVVMCESELVPKYEAFSQGTSILESSLHRNLAEHINSEIGLGTITSMDTAKTWLRQSFLFQRLRQNPSYYALGDDDAQVTWQERIDNVVSKSVNQLKKNQLVQCKTGTEHDSLISTEYGEIMSKFYIRQNTMVDILTSSKNASLRDLLELISKAEEFTDSKPRASEKSICNILRKHRDIRFEVKKVDSAADKVFVLVQAVLGGISLNAPEYSGSDVQLSLEAFSVFKHVDRIARAIVEVATARKYGRQVKDGLELVRCLSAKAWEDRPIVLRQIDQLGEKSIKVLAENGVTTLDQLRLQSPLRLEALLNRRPGFGYDLLASVDSIPRYELSVKELEVNSDSSNGCVELDLSIGCGLANNEAYTKAKQKKPKRRTFDMTSILTVTSDWEFIDFRRIQTKALKERKTFTAHTTLTKPSQSVFVYISSDNFAGTCKQERYKPDVTPGTFRVPVTKPCTAIELDLEGLEDDPDFWKMTIDDENEEETEELDVAQKKGARSGLTRSLANAQPAPGQSRVPISPAIDLASQVRKLPNGSYDCQNGLPKPPKTPNLPKPSKGKEGTFNSAASDPKPRKTVSKVQRLHAAKDQVAIRNDKKMEDLQRMHDGANVAERLQLPKGQRVKIESPPKSIRAKEKAKRGKPNFELTFSEIGKSSEMNEICFPSLEELDDEDLPLCALDPIPAKNVSSPIGRPGKRSISVSSTDSDMPVVVEVKRTKFDWDEVCCPCEPENTCAHFESVSVQSIPENRPQGSFCQKATMKL
ncbi:P-loop containing nucleoside triphosphate hydrolase protein [Coprinopsis marcescibilis]|uniref:DNA 3'-5' helicase n=1 Tax=Coprinopsis marcescibilis TaxID=230819 RepID=A0A5C3LB97_COPMA|nr:P-loop containing nucleoside triphosphate hydrolase protein [Coprinopsis marcescibilis]